MTNGNRDTSRASAMIDVITPSYFPDLELCRDLNASLMRHTGDTFRHKILVSRQDLPVFRDLEGGRTSVVDVRDLLPRSFFRLPGVNGWLSARRPWPPVRGWIAQQIIKLAATARSDADVVVLLDSDLVIVRDLDASTFIGPGGPALYRRDRAIHAGMSRHVLWHHASRQLLGLHPAEVSPPLADYVCSPCTWSPELVRQMLRRIEEVTRVPWQVAVGSCLHFSEMILYGVYVDELLEPSARPRVVDDMRCVLHYDEVPLAKPEIEALVSQLRPEDIAVMINAKSGTDLQARREVLGPLAGADLG